MTPAALTRLQQRKLTARFRLLDRDDDGHVELSDYIHLATSMASAVDADDEVYDQARETFTRMFERMSLQGGQATRQSVTLYQFLTVTANKIVARPERFDQVMGPACCVTFRLGASAGDVLHRENFARLYTAVGVPRSYAMRNARLAEKAPFEGTRYADYVSLYREFYLGDDPNAPENFLYGPF